MEHDNIGKQLNLDRVTIAGVYAASLGSSASFAKDRDALAALLEVFPGQIDYAWNNRGFLRRAVIAMCDMGIRQFLDIGSGLPVVGNVHEVAHKIDPAASVAYVDIDPIAVHHARELLELEGAPRNVTSSDVDMRDPEKVLTAPGVLELIDFTQPVGLLMLGILDIIDTRETLDTASIVAAYRDACPPGSALAISNAAQQDMPDEVLDAILAMGAQTSTPVVTYRSAAEVAAFFEGYQLLDPGIVPTGAWRPDKPISDQDAAKSNAWAGVGISTTSTEHTGAPISAPARAITNSLTVTRGDCWLFSGFTQYRPWSVVARNAPDPPLGAGPMNAWYRASFSGPGRLASSPAHSPDVLVTTRKPVTPVGDHRPPGRSPCSAWEGRLPGGPAGPTIEHMFYSGDGVSADAVPADAVVTASSRAQVPAQWAVDGSDLTPPARVANLHTVCWRAHHEHGWRIGHVELSRHPADGPERVVVWEPRSGLRWVFAGEHIERLRVKPPSAKGTGNRSTKRIG